jgi:hypothetical protein
MTVWRRDPGPCPICGAAHTACTATEKKAPIVAGRIVSATSIAVSQPSAAGEAVPQLEAERVQETLPAGHVTTGTYRRANSRATKGDAT